MNAELYNKSIDGLFEQIGQQIELVKNAENTSGQLTLPGPEGMAVKKNGEWLFQFKYDQPEDLKMIVTITTQIPTSKKLNFSAELKKFQVTTLIGWLTRISSMMDEAI